MRRKLLIAGVSLLGLILILAAAVFFYIRSGRLDLLLQREIVAALDEAGVRAQLDTASLDLRGSKVTLEGLHLFVKENGKEFGDIAEITANFSITSYLKQEVNLTDVRILHPKFTVQLDEQGRFNLDPLLTGSTRHKEEKGPVSFLTAKFEIQDGEVDFADRRHNVTAHITGLTARFTPSDQQPLKDELNHRLQLSFAGGTATYLGRSVDKIGVDVEAAVTEKNARVEKLELKSGLATVSTAGTVDEFAPLKYDLPSVRVEAVADQIARVFAPDIRLSGKVTFNGQVSGTGADYHAAGGLESSALVAEGVRISSLRVKTKVDGSSLDYKATAELSSAAIGGRGFEVGSVGLSGARVNGRESDFDLRGALRLTSLKNGVLAIGGIRGNISADRKRVGLSSFSADVLGGTATGSVSMGLNGGGSQVDVQFKTIDLSQAATLAAAKEVKVRGTASGSAGLSFPGLNYKRAKGRIEASIDGEVSPAESDGGGSATGELLVTATGNGFKVERASIKSGPSSVSATGEIGWEGKGAFDFEFKSTDMSDLQQAIESFGVVPPEVKERYEIGLEGEGSFKGHADVDLSYGDADVTGHIRLASIKLHDEDAGEFQGDVSYSSSKIRVGNASIARPDGSRADFELAASLADKDGLSIKANVQDYSLPAIVKAVVPSLKDFVERGYLTGTVDLKGLPGPRSIEGTAEIVLSNAEFALPSPEEGEETKKKSVPELRGEVSVADSLLTVKNLQMRFGDSKVAGRGSFNLDTYEYSIDAGAKDIDLAQISDALAEGLSLTGRADAKLVGQGKWGNADDWSDLNLNGAIEGRNVAINGRDLGNAKLTAVTDNGLLRIEAAGKVAEQMRSVSGTVDLRDRKNYPVDARIEFDDADIAPFIGWIAPQLKEISGRATGSIKLAGPLQEPDDIQVIAAFTSLEIGGAISEGRRYTINNQGDFVVRGGAKGITVERSLFTGEGTSIAIEGALAREGAGKTSLAIDGEINLRLLSSFTPVVFATGIAQVQASIAGSLESPQLLGVMTLKDVGVRIVDFPLSAAHGNGQIRFTSNQALIERFVATTPGGGSITIGGGAALAGLVPDRWRLDVKADQVGGEYPRDTQTVVDADLTLQGNRRLQVMSGNLEVRRASYTKDVTLEELITSGGPFKPEFLEAGPGGSGAPSGLQTTLDIHVIADNTLIVKNNLADAVGSAYLNVRGSLDQPQVSGRILLARGTLEFRNGRWDLIRGLTTIPGGRAEPIIDFQAEADIRGYHVTTNFSGEVSKLQVLVRSEPELPEPDIISLVLTGSISGDRSTIASTSQTGLGLAQSILSASLSEQLERGTQRLFGLSRFSIDPLLVGRGNDPTARITVGQRVTRDLTVTYSQNLSSGVSGVEQVVLVEYRLSNRFSVVAFRNERGELGFDVRLRKRF